MSPPAGGAPPAGGQAAPGGGARAREGHARFAALGDRGRSLQEAVLRLEGARGREQRRPEIEIRVHYQERRRDDERDIAEPADAQVDRRVLPISAVDAALAEPALQGRVPARDQHPDVVTEGHLIELGVPPADLAGAAEKPGAPALREKPGERERDHHERYGGKDGVHATSL